MKQYKMGWWVEGEENGFNMVNIVNHLVAVVCNPPNEYAVTRKLMTRETSYFQNKKLK